MGRPDRNDRSFHPGRIAIMAAAVTVVLSASAALSPAGAEAIEVQMDNARLLKVPEGTDTIVVGNPTIADVSVQRNAVMVVTGKNFGTTNMIAVDAKGAIISESTIVVTIPHRERMTVVRGSDIETYACNPHCGPVQQVGDSEKHFARAGSQARDRAANATQGNTPPR